VSSREAVMKYARIAINELRSGTINISIDRAEKELLPLFRNQPGFISYAVYRVDERSVASVSVWETREAAENAVHLAEDWIKSSLAESMVASRVVVGELAFESEGPSLFQSEEPAPPLH
jgi:heme-degrading monooxygenase HmoA